MVKNDNCKGLIITYLFSIYFIFIILLIPFGLLIDTYYMNDFFLKNSFVIILLSEIGIIILLVIITLLCYYLYNFTIIKKDTLEKLKSN